MAVLLRQRPLSRLEGLRPLTKDPTLGALSPPCKHRQPYSDGYRNLSCRPTTRISHFVADSSFGLLSPINDIITRSMSSAGGGGGCVFDDLTVGSGCSGGGGDGPGPASPKTGSNGGSGIVLIAYPT